jgi:hypothetical protein
MEGENVVSIATVIKVPSVQLHSTLRMEEGNAVDIQAVKKLPLVQLLSALPMEGKTLSADVLSHTCGQEMNVQPTSHRMDT